MSGAAQKTLYLALFGLSLLTACGGGGGSSPATSTSGGTPPPQPQILTITTPFPLPLAVQGLPYSTTFTASGGQGALHWSIAPIVAGTVPVNGLAMDPNTGVLSGTANFAGNQAFQVTVTDSASPVKTATQGFNLTATTPLSVLPANTINVVEFFNGQVVNVFITGGIAPFRVSLDRQCLPPGMKPNPANVAIGNQIPTIVVGGALALGTYTCNVTVQDSFASPEVASQTLTIKVSSPNLLVAGALPSRLLLNRPMSARILALGGTPPYTLKQLAASLPAGVAFDSTTGVVSGTPTTAGPYSLTVSASDSSSPAQSAVQFFSGTAAQPLGRNDSPATATPLPNTAFPSTVIASGSISPYIDPPNGTPAPGDQDYYQLQSLGGAIVHVAASASASVLDTVIEIVDGNGVRFSTCRQPGDTSTNFTSGCVNDDIAPGNQNSALDLQVPGTTTANTNFYVHVLDFRGDARPDMGYQLAASGIATPLQITTGPAMGGLVGFAFVQPLNASGGTGQYNWSIPSGTLPPNVALQGSLLVSSTQFTTTGTFTFDIRVNDPGPPQQSATKTVTLTVGTPLHVTTTSLPPGKVATAYSATVATSGGVPPLSFTTLGTWLPPGLTLNSTTGNISGTPTAAGTFSGQVEVQDLAQEQLFRPLTIVVNP